MKHLFILLLTGLVFAACKQSPTSPSDPGVIMPLKIGNQWIGQVSADSSGATVAGYDTLTITQEVVINNETWYKTNQGDLYINRADGLWYLAYQSATCACKLVQYPAKRGDTMMLPAALAMLPSGTTPVDGNVEREVISTDASITVPAGTFSCFVYKDTVYSPANARLRIQVEKDYIPNLGLVRLVYGGKLKWELFKVTLK